MKNPEKKLTFWFLAATGLLLGAVIALNYVMDPAHLFEEGKYEQGVADLLLQKKNVGNVTNYDERILQRDYVAGTAKAPDVVVFGSSRSMQIRGDNFKGQTFFNSAVSGANLEDLLAIYGIYHKKGQEPRSVVLGIDPWMFNKNNGQSRWTSVASDYTDFLNVLLVPTTEADMPANGPFTKLQQLVSMDYTKSSLQKLRSGNREYYATDEREAKDSIKLADGSLVYGEEMRNSSVAKVNQQARVYADTYPVYSLGNFTELDPQEREKFEKFMLYLKGQGTNVTIFLPPYHPIVYQVLKDSPEYQVALQVETYLRDLAKQQHLKIIGSYDPAVAGAGEQDFYDGMHPKTEFVYKVLAE